MAKGQEVQEEQQPQVSEDQLEEMEDVLETSHDDEDEPAESPAEKEPDKGAPPAEEKAKGSDDDAATEKAELKEKGKKEEEAKAESDSKQKGEDPEFETLTKDGVRNVKLSALKTTYQQHGALQAKHKSIKPCLDLFEEAQIPPDRMFEFLVAGIQAIHAGTQRHEPPGSVADKSQGYQGPFASEQEEADMKEADPQLYRTAKALWDQNRNLTQQIAGLVGKLEQQQRAPQQAPTQNAEPSPERKRVDGLIGGVQTTHDKYFKAHPDRLDGFKTFLGTKFSSVPLESVDDNFMAVAFQMYDPAYYAAWHEEQVKARLEKQRDTRRRTFGETDSVRGSVASSMTEQQELMADILDF